MANDFSFDDYDDDDIAAFAAHAQGRKQLHDAYGDFVEAPTEADEAALAEWHRRLENR